MIEEKEKIEVAEEKNLEADKRAEKLRLFRDEIEKLREEEIKAEEEAVRSGKKSGTTFHFASPSFDVSELTEEDMAIWGKIKDESLTWEEYEGYRSKLLAAGILKREEMKMSSRAAFFDAFSNKANRILMRKPRAHAGN